MNATPWKGSGPTKGGAGKRTANKSPSCSSKVTIYKRAVQQLAPEIGEQIDQFIAATRTATEVDCNKTDSRKVSSSSEELMDTSDEIEVNNLSGMRFTLISDKSQEMARERTPQEIAEKSKARVYEPAGMVNQIQLSFQNSALELLNMDNDYQMVDTHVDEGLKKRY